MQIRQVKTRSIGRSSNLNDNQKEFIRYPTSISNREDFLYDRESPGPGSYSPSVTTYSPRISFPRSERTINCVFANTPGPGQYPIKIKSNGPRFSLKGKLSALPPSPNPGPAAYSPSLDFSTERFPSIKIGNSRRNIHNHPYSPGPGTYSLDLSICKGPKWKFGNEKRKGIAAQSLNGPLVGFEKESEGRDSVTPGPGAYDPIRPKKSVSAIIGTGARQPIAERKSPGPGSYNPEKSKKIQSSTFGSANRHLLDIPVRYSNYLIQDAAQQIKNRRPQKLKQQIKSILDSADSGTVFQKGSEEKRHKKYAWRFEKSLKS